MDEKTATKGLASQVEDIKPLARLERLFKVFGNLYVIGGMPLVIVALALANMLLPYKDVSQSIVGSIILTAFGAILSIFYNYMSAKKWAAEMAILAEQDRLVLATLCQIVTTEKSDTVDGKTEALFKQLDKLGIRRLGEPQERTE